MSEPGYRYEPVLVEAAADRIVKDAGGFDQSRWVDDPRNTAQAVFDMSTAIGTWKSEGQRVLKLTDAAYERGKREGAAAVREAVEAALERVVRFDGSCEYVTADSVHAALDAAAPTGGPE